MVVLETQIQPVTRERLAGHDSIDLGRAFLPDAHQFVAQFNSRFTLIANHGLQQFDIVCRHLLRAHACGVIIVHRKKIHVHVIDIQHGLVDPLAQIGMQLLHLENQAIHQRLSAVTRHQEQLIRLGIGEIRIQILDLQSHDFMGQRSGLWRIRKAATAQPRGFEGQPRIHSIQAEYQLGAGQGMCANTQAQLAGRVWGAQRHRRAFLP
ncbi:hypothetical protein D3C87_1448230 [compost metagenome]